MKFALALGAAAALAGCGKAVAPPRDEPVAVTGPARPAVPPVSRPYIFDEKNELIEFHFAWSAEAAAVPQLAEKFKQEMAKARTAILEGATAERAWLEEKKLEFHGFQSSTDYETAGQSPRLLSLSVSTGSFTGGAHPNHGINSLLWDRGTAREIKSSDLFAQPANRDRLLTQRWCDALNRQRQEKRGAPVGGSDLFDDCTSLDAIAFLPTDKDGNGRFERLMLVASPYVAGPYAEGYYEVELMVTPDLIATLKSDYRDSFEAAQLQ